MEYTYFNEIPYEILGLIFIHLNYDDINNISYVLNLHKSIYNELWKNMLTPIFWVNCVINPKNFRRIYINLKKNEL